MSVELNTSAVYATNVRVPQSFRFEDEEASVVGLSLAEKETYNLARKAESGDSLWDKTILNLVHPPALMLFALLDSGRKVAMPPLEKVQEAYNTVSNATQEVESRSATGSSDNTVKTTVHSEVSAPTPSAATTPTTIAPSRAVAQTSAPTTIIA